MKTNRVAALAVTALLAVTGCSSTTSDQSAPTPEPVATTVAAQEASVQFGQTMAEVNNLFIGISRDGKTRYKDLDWNTLIDDIPGLYPGATATWDAKTTEVTLRLGQCRGSFQYEATSVGTPSVPTSLECDGSSPLRLGLKPSAQLAATEIQGLSATSEARYRDLDWEKALKLARSKVGERYTVELAEGGIGVVVDSGSCEATVSFVPGELGTAAKVTLRGC
jgi:hypothetical protein